MTAHGAHCSDDGLLALAWWGTCLLLHAYLPPAAVVVIVVCVLFLIPYCPSLDV